MKTIIDALKDSLKSSHSSVSFKGRKIDLLKESVSLNHSAVKNENRILFVDGGEGIVFSSASAIVFRVRVTGVLFKGTEREKVIVKEFTCLVSGNSLTFSETPDFPVKIEPAVPLQEISGKVRKVLEAGYAAKWAKEEKPDIAVLDGLLSAYGGLVGGIVTPLIGIAKTSSMASDEGSSLVSAFHSLEKGAGFAVVGKPASNSKGEKSKLFVCVAKLHAAAFFSFVVECNPKDEKGIKGLLEPMLPLCADVSFLGYPYPLVLADQLARISQQELSVEKTRILVSLSDKSLSFQLSSNEAHSVLDTMRF